ncbi:HlyD family efflux transporter periplasmic adaptor subunit [Salipiger mangrovisoli]|nr:HlyD family efflux transporter periplasmic adaptor subunit [Salipiger mangrovisoli]
MATGLLLAGDILDSSAFTLAAQWPAGGPPEDDLQDLARQALSTRQPVVIGEGTARRLLAQPLIVDEGLFGAVAVAVPASAAPTATLFRRLQWAAGWIELMLRREQEARDGELRERMTLAFDVLATLLERPKLAEAASALVTELARRLDCETVSIGLKKGRRMKIRAVSSAASFGRRVSLIKEVQHAMDEAVDQQAVVLWPEPEGWDFRVTRAHEDLARSHAVGAVLTIPLTSGSEVIGALTFERREGLGFSATEVEICDAVASVAGPILRDRELAGRWLPRRILGALGDLLLALLGPVHFGAKLATLAAAGLAAFLWVATTNYDVTSVARIEGTVQRSLVAPFNGYLASQSARAGDVVAAGQVIAVLDEKDLGLERLRLATALQQRTRELERAIAEREIAEANIIRAQMNQAEAQLALVEEQLARTRIRAPFAGYVVEGDLSQNVGGAIERGQTLFKIAPLESFRVVLEVDEHDIDEIAEAQTGSLRLSAFPERPLDYRVTSITPLARQGEGRNFFRVEAEPLGDSAALRPGMEGIARTAIAEARLAWVLSHKIVDWARLAWWRWQP